VKLLKNRAGILYELHAMLPNCHVEVVGTHAAVTALFISVAVTQVRAASVIRVHVAGFAGENAPIVSAAAPAPD
jgi:hypothetical protein